MKEIDNYDLVGQNYREHVLACKNHAQSLTETPSMGAVSPRCVLNSMFSLLSSVVHVSATTCDCILTLQQKEVGSGNFGVTYLAKDKRTGETVAVKFIER